MGVVISPSSELGKELRKWEQHNTMAALEDDGMGGQRFAPGRPYQYRPYPRMVYKATKLNTGKWICCPPTPMPQDFDDMSMFERAMLLHDTLTKQCQRIVHSEAEERQAKNDGWREDPHAALEHQEALEQAVAQAAGEAIYRADRMSEKARAEFKDAEAQTSEHVVDVKPAKRGRKPKAVSGSGVVEESA